MALAVSTDVEQFLIVYHGGYAFILLILGIRL